jgi:DNA-binding ferritin-like protein
MRFLRRLCGCEALERRVDEMKTALDTLAERVVELE